MRRFEKSVIIDAAQSAVWDALTNPDPIRQWMGGRTNIEVITDWKVGEPILIRGIHQVPFENTGTVLRFEPEQVLRYSHLSSLSHLPDEPQNYTTMEFNLESAGSGTLLRLIVENFPTDTIYRHLNFYWETTLMVLKRYVEQSRGSV